MKESKRNFQNFYKPMLVIAFPVIVQNLISLGLNMIDSIMIGKLGVNPLAAVGIANRIYFVFSMVCFGIYSGSAIFIAQYWGANDTKNIKKLFGMDLFLGIIISIVVTAFVLIFPRELLSMFSDEPEVIELAVKYIRIAAVSYILTALSYAVSFISRSIHMLKIPTIISAIAIVINTILNYCLIYGVAGFPRLEVEGAAIATFIARFVEFVLMFLYVYISKNHPLAGTYKEYMSWDFKMFKKTLSTSLPVIISESSWSIGNTVYYIAYGMLGPSSLAVVQVAYIINDLSQCIFFGAGNASAVMIGNEIGRKDYDKALDYSKVYLKMTFILNIIMTAALILSRNLIVAIYDFDAETSLLLEKCIIVFAIYLTPKMFSYMFICGILRAGGDTKFCMYLGMIALWFVGIPLSFFSVLVLKLPIYLALAVTFTEELVKLGAEIYRYRSMKWLNNLIE